MNTTTTLNESNMLVTPSREYNYEIHAKLSRIISNMARKKQSTNWTSYSEDLEQEAWARIFEIIEKGKNEGKYFEINYLVTVAKNTILGSVIKQKKLEDNYDSLLNAAYNDSTINNQVKSNALKNRNNIEYQLLKNESTMADKVELRLALEQMLTTMTDERTRNFIMIKYIKEFDGDSPTIIALYNTYHDSLPIERQQILDDMKDSCTNAMIFRAMGLRDTDNCTTKIRNKTKVMLGSLV